jgi:hypothetical protein
VGLSKLNLPVFLSASEPYERRAREYWEARRLINIREAVRALVAHVLPRWPLVFGGHPSVTPLVQGIADHVAHVARREDPNTTFTPQYLVYRTLLYGPSEDKEHGVDTPAHYRDWTLGSERKGSRNASLLRMRYEMLGKPTPNALNPGLKEYWPNLGADRASKLKHHGFIAAFFIGGMEGVEREFNIFRTFHPTTPVFPVASTGSAAQKLWQAQFANESWAMNLMQQPSYSLLFADLLRPASEPVTDARSMPPLTSANRTNHLDPAELDRDFDS